MDCSNCGEPIDLDLMRCKACGHDMLPQDVSRGYFASGVPAAKTGEQFAEALNEVRRGSALHGLATESYEDQADRTRRMRRDYWRVAVFIAALIGIAIVLSIL